MAILEDGEFASGHNDFRHAMYAMHPELLQLCAMGESMGVRRDLFVRRLVSRKATTNRHMPCTHTLLVSKMVMWLRKRTSRHSFWSTWEKKSLEASKGGDAVAEIEGATSRTAQLFHALEHGYNEEKIYHLARVFVGDGFDANAVGAVETRPGEGITVLQAACFFKRVKTVQFLLKRGGDANRVDDQNGENAAFYAVKDHWTRTTLKIEHAKKTCEILASLLEAGANFALQNVRGETVLHHVAALQTSPESQHIQEKHDILCVLKRGASIESIVNHAGENAIVTAAKHSPGDVLLFLKLFASSYSRRDRQNVLLAMTDTRQFAQKKHIVDVLCRQIADTPSNVFCAE